MNVKRLLLPIGMIASLAIAAACGSTTPTSETPGDTTGSGTTTATTTSSAPVTTNTATVTPPNSATPATSGSSTASNPPAAQKWSDLKNDGDRAAFMSKAIVPAMKPVFSEFDAAKYGKFGCETCHGPQRKAPKDFLPKLTLKGGKEFVVSPDKAAVLKFMMEKVTPEMAKAMGEKPYDPATKTGFGCGGCHVIDMK
ncbi:MAG: hypothetical protein U0414_08435 [Polyangiaceae bacterium]